MGKRRRGDSRFAADGGAFEIRQETQRGCYSGRDSGRIFAYYYDLPFEETVRRHNTRAKVNSFGAEDMKRWWNEKDFLGNIAEEIFTLEIRLEEAEDLIYNRVAG